MITFYFFFDFLVDMVDKGEKCPKYHNLRVIYDAAHAFGETIDGKNVANLGSQREQLFLQVGREKADATGTMTEYANKLFMVYT